MQIDQATSQTIERAVRGDQEALVELLTSYGSTVRFRIRREMPLRWQNLLSEDDVMQATYADAFRSIGGFRARGGRAFCAWLEQLARRNVIDAVRTLEAEKRGGGRRPAPLIYDSHLRLFDVLAATTTSPSHIQSSHEMQTALADAISELPLPYREVVQLYDIEELDATRVAEQIGRTVGAMYMMRARAHRLLRQRLHDPPAANIDV